MLFFSSEILTARIISNNEHRLVVRFPLGGRPGGVMVSVLDSGSSDPGSSLGRGTALCSWEKPSHGASLHPGI